jgi:hypothetical protein
MYSCRLCYKVYTYRCDTFKKFIYIHNICIHKHKIKVVWLELLNSQSWAVSAVTVASSSKLLSVPWSLFHWSVHLPSQPVRLIFKGSLPQFSGSADSCHWPLPGVPVWRRQLGGLWSPSLPTTHPWTVVCLSVLKLKEFKVSLVQNQRPAGVRALGQP